MSTSKKSYGLLLKKNQGESKPCVKPVAAAFADSDDDGDLSECRPTGKESASTIRAKVQAKRMHDKALAEDPTIFQYDTIYDNLQAAKNEKVAEAKAADKQKKSKYAEQILGMHKRRLIEQQSREERKQQKEREVEGSEFADKEKFVTSSYKQQLIEMEKFRQQEAIEDRLNDLTAVEKQKAGMWKGGFYRTVLDNLVGEDKVAIKDDKEIKQEVIDEPASQKQSENKTDLTDSQSSSQECGVKNQSHKKIRKRIPSEKSSSSSSNEEPETSKAAIDLKPGINILKSSKKLTKAEQVRRRFTPSPEESYEEDIVESRENRKWSSSHDTDSKYKSRHREKKSDSATDKKEYKSDRSSDKVENKSDKSSDKKQIEKTKEERLLAIKKILAHRNSRSDIKQMRARYLQRKAENAVPLPLCTSK